MRFATESFRAGKLNDSFGVATFKVQKQITILLPLVRPSPAGELLCCNFLIPHISIIENNVFLSFRLAFSAYQSQET